MDKNVEGIAQRYASIGRLSILVGSAPERRCRKSVGLRAYTLAGVELMVGGLLYRLILLFFSSLTSSTPLVRVVEVKECCT